MVTTTSWRLHPLYSIFCPLVSLLGGILVWVGVWDWCIDYLHGGEMRSDMAYMFVGLAFLFATRTVIAQAGLKPIAFMPRVSNQWGQNVAAFLAMTTNTVTQSSSRVLLGARSLLALLAGILFWLGTYNLFDLYVYYDAGLNRDIVYTVVGLVTMFATSNISSEGAIISETIDSELASQSPMFAKSPSIIIESPHRLLWYYIKAIVGLYGDVIYWVGVYNIADVHLWEYDRVRDALYFVVGMLAFLCVSIAIQRERETHRALAHQSHSLAASGSTLSWQSATSLPEKFIFVVRSLIAMIAGVVVWVGAWNILSYYIVDTQDLSGDGDGGDGGSDDDDNTGGMVAHAFSLLSLTTAGITGTVSITDTGAGSLNYHDRHFRLASHTFHLLSRSEQSQSSFPVWLLYVIYVLIGLVLLVATNTLTLTAGSVQPLSLIRAQTKVGGDKDDRYGGESVLEERVEWDARAGLIHAVQTTTGEDT